jgi:hypothetical protein
MSAPVGLYNSIALLLLEPSMYSLKKISGTTTETI